MIDVKSVTTDIENFQDKREQRDTAKHHVREIAEECADEEPHFRSVLTLFLLGAPLVPLSNGVDDFLSASKTTKGRSVTGPKVCLGFCVSVGSVAGAEASTRGEDAGESEGEREGRGRAGAREGSRNNLSNFARASGGKSSFFRSASISARSFGPSLPGST